MRTGMHIIALNQGEFLGYVDAGYRANRDLRFAITFVDPETAKNTASAFNRFGFSTAILQVVDVTNT